MWDWLSKLSALEVMIGSIGIVILVQLLLIRLLLLGVKRTRTDVDDKIVALLRWPLTVTILAVGGSVAASRMEPGPTEKALEVLDAVLISVTVLFWTRAGMRISNVVLDALARRAEDYKWIEARTVPLLDIVTKLALLGGAAYGLLLAWGVDVTAWLASAGIVGIAVGFAAKDTLANLFAGIFILTDAPYKLGDYIVLDTGERGRVTNVGLRSTRLLTRDDVEVTIPNAVIANAKVVNESGGPYEKERVRVTIGIEYGSDIDRAREVLIEIAAECKLIAEHPQPRVRFRELGDSALKFQLMGWIERPALRGRTLDWLNSEIYKRFAAAGIELALPQRVVHMREK